MNRYVCVHGHFYQPPRENPWLEEIELQDSAYPYHDWNDRINTECYAPNTMSRILDEQGRIARIVNNFSRLSFNFGPTLLAWMQEKAGDTYRRIIEGDEQSRERFSGHGSAIAQAYNHIILPLATRRDKMTQVKWGIADFVARFNRQPEGMWLPETAVDIETLEVLAEQGIKFTILAPRQAARYRPLDDDHDEESWLDVEHDHIDATRVYVQKLPSGKSINLFFYDGPISQGIAFERLLANGKTFSDRLAGALPTEGEVASLVNIATDGETYGHHHRHGDMALAYALEGLDHRDDITLTNYGEFLEQHPPAHEVQIVEQSSWSCVHGVGRWHRDCGCNTGGHGDWNQAWRQPLREALDWLRDTVRPRLDARAGECLRDAEQAMDDYISVILDRSNESVESYFEKHASQGASEASRTEILQLMELHRNLQLMYTSCGWFFDELSGIETVQVIHYAARAISLFDALFQEDLQGPFMEHLSRAQSNIPEHGSGRDIYEKWVRPARIGLEDVGGHFAISSLFPHADEPEEDGASGHKRAFCFIIDEHESRSFTSGRLRLAFGRARITSSITRETAALSWGALHLGDHNVLGNARCFQSNEDFELLVNEAKVAFDRADIPETIRVLDRHFGEEHRYSVMSVFRDEQRRILDHILNATLQDVERAYRQVHDNNISLMRSLSSLGAPLPKALRMTAEFVLNSDLSRAFAGARDDGRIDADVIRQMFEDTRAWSLELDVAGLSYTLQRSMEAIADKLAHTPRDMQLLEQLDRVAILAQSLPFEIDLWKTQNVYYDLGRAMLEHHADEQAQPDIQHNGQWLERFRSLGEKLHVGV